jgi:cell division protein FtsI/penicillin-binding protein 2
MRRRIDHWRLLFFLGATLVLLSVIGYRVFTIAYVRHNWYSSAAKAHADQSHNVLARGTIYMADRDGELHITATNKKFPILAVNASQISEDNRETIREFLVEVGGLEPGEADTLLSIRDELSRPVGRYLTDEEASRVEDADISGLDVAYISDRFYPYESLAANVIGFFGYDPGGRHGQYGVEAYYERELSGVEESSQESSTSPRRWLAGLFGANDEDTSADVPISSDVVLTIDRRVQVYVEDVLAATLERFGSTTGSVIVQDVTSGAIIAMADSPSFDPNRYGEAPAEAFLNGPSQRSFEPGSSFKPFTMSIGLDEKVVTPDSTFTDSGPVHIAGHTIRNFTDVPFGTVTMTGVLEKSINTGVMYVQKLIGDDQFLDHLIDYGFGQKTGIDLPGEATGNIANLYSGRKINYLTASFGQGITVTPLQLAVGYSAIANGGKLMRPYVVDRVIRESTLVSETEPEIVGIPISKKTADQMRTMLVSVVDNGFDKARIARYDVAGKTGTAQIADPEGGYLEEEHIHSFTGFIPGTDPQYTIVVVLERPKGVTFAADSLSPVFKDIATFLINYYRIPPTR